MEKNNFEVQINTSVEKVWYAITNSTEFNKWMKSVTVQTDWKEGSTIVYTCYDENGKVMQWEGIDMIWDGLIEKIEKNKVLTCVYPSKSTGLVEESYYLEKLSENKTKLTQVQSLISKEVADGYKEGTAHSLELLKTYLEKKPALKKYNLNVVVLD